VTSQGNAEMLLVVEKINKVLDRLMLLDANSEKTAWELIAELQELVDQLRRIHPAPALIR
jgi:hypothetical protein